MKTLNDKLTEKATLECSNLYYNTIQRFIRNFMSTFNIPEDVMRKNPLLQPLWNMQYSSGSSTQMLEIITPLYVDNYLNDFCKKVEEMQEMLEDHLNDN